MVAWKKDPCSRAASIKIDEVINRVTRLLRKPKTTWTETDYNDSAKVISYISRASAIKDSIIPAKPKWGCRKGKNFYALKNWAYDRKKEKTRRQNTISKRKSSYITNNPYKPSLNLYEVPILETLVYVKKFGEKLNSINKNTLLNFNFSSIDNFIDQTWPSNLEYSPEAKLIVRNWMVSIAHTTIARQYLKRREFGKVFKNEIDQQIRFNNFVKKLEEKFGRFSSKYITDTIPGLKPHLSPHLSN